MEATITLLCTICIYMNIVPVKLIFVLFHTMFLKKYPGSTAVLKHCIPATADTPIVQVCILVPSLLLYTLHIIPKIHYRTERKRNMGLWITTKGKNNHLGQQQSQV